MSAGYVKDGRTAPGVRAPDGRVFLGRYPQDVPRNSETEYCVALAELVGGVLEVVLPAGRADVATNEVVFEVESIATWRHGAQQAFAYGAMSGLKPALALFGRDEYLDVYLEVRDKMLGLDLWVWRNGGWVHATSRASVGRPTAKPSPIARRDAPALVARPATPPPPRVPSGDPEIERWHSMSRDEQLAENPCRHGGEHASEVEATVCLTVRLAPPLSAAQRSFLAATLRPHLKKDSVMEGRPS